MSSLNPTEFYENREGFVGGEIKVQRDADNESGIFIDADRPIWLSTADTRRLRDQLNTILGGVTDTAKPDVLADWEREMAEFAKAREAWREGYDLGRKEGLNEARNEGWSAGHREGHRKGYELGRSEAVDKGRQVALGDIDNAFAEVTNVLSDLREKYI